MKWALLGVALGVCVGCQAEVESAQAPWEGTLLLLEEAGPPVLTSLGLPNGAHGDVQELPSMTFAYELDVHAPSGVMALAYTAPPLGEEPGFDRSGIYVQRPGASLERLAGQDAPGVWCSYPVWDGAERLWFAVSGEREDVGVRSVRVDVETGEEELEIEWATELAVAPTREHLAWVAVDPVTGVRRLVLGDPQGRELRTLVADTEHADLGLPTFSSDGRSVYYVGIPGAPTSYLAHLTQWLVGTAHAHGNHNSPGDWWRVSVEGGAPTRVTSLKTIQYDGRAVEDGVLVIATREGVYLVDEERGASGLVLTSRTVRALVTAP